jgi:hypothetical protein
VLALLALQTLLLPPQFLLVLLLQREARAHGLLGGGALERLAAPALFLHAGRANQCTHTRLCICTCENRANNDVDVAPALSPCSQSESESEREPYPRRVREGGGKEGREGGREKRRYQVGQGVGGCSHRHRLAPPASQTPESLAAPLLSATSSRARVTGVCVRERQRKRGMCE